MADEILFYGALWCPDCKRSRRFLGEQQIDYTYVDIEKHSEGHAYLEAINDGKRIIPTIVFPDGSILTEPSNMEGVYYDQCSAHDDDDLL